MTAALLFGQIAFAESAEAPRPPDVLLIIAEDLKACLGCYGNPIVQTPNLDALAAQGVRFDRAYCQFPLCNPSRSSLLTGLRPETTRVFGNTIDWNGPLKGLTTLPEHFRSHGYETVRVSKIFHAGNQGRVFDDSARWERIIPSNQGLPKPGRAARPGRFLYEDASAEQRQKNYDMRAWKWGPSGLDDMEMADGMTAEQAVRELSRKHDRPLFFAVGFHCPHLSLVAPDQYFAMYPPEKIPLPANPPNDLDDVPGSYSLANQERFTPEKEREAIAAYYACVSYMDACVGRVLGALKETGRDKNTIVVFLGDHGFHLGEHFLWQKMTLFEESARVCLILSAPNMRNKGAVCERLVEFVDLFPTLAELCGLEIPPGLEGTSMKALLDSPDRPWKKAAFTMLGGKGRSVRTERWRYTEWGSPPKAELYDHESDPGEFVNRAADGAWAEVAAELSQLLRKGWRAALPPR